MGPFAAVWGVVKTVWRQVTGGVGSGTVPSSVRTAAADPIQESLDDLATEHARLVAGGDVEVPERFDEFLAGRLFDRPLVPDVAVVSRPRRWASLLLGVAVGFLVGTVTAAGLLVGLWVATTYASQEPTLVVTGLVALVGVTVLASLVKGLAMRYGRGRPPRWSTAR
jgi:hypothetical protein